MGSFSAFFSLRFTITQKEMKSSQVKGTEKIRQVFPTDGTPSNRF